jgi:hypothetical protein
VVTGEDVIGFMVTGEDVVGLLLTGFDKGGFGCFWEGVKGFDGFDGFEGWVGVGTGFFVPETCTPVGAGFGCQGCCIELTKGLIGATSGLLTGAAFG